MPRNSDLVVYAQLEILEFQEALRTAERNLQRFADRADRSVQAVARAGAVAGAALTAAAVAATQYATEVSRISRATNVGARDVQIFSRAVRILGKDQESLNDLFIDTADRLQEVRDGNRTYVEDFRLLGLEARNFVDLNPADAVRQIAEAVRDSPDQIRALAAAARILPEFQAILPLLGDELERAANAPDLLTQEEVARAEQLGARTSEVALTFQQGIARGFLDELEVADGTMELLITGAADLGTVLGQAASVFVNTISPTIAAIRAVSATVQGGSFNPAAAGAAALAAIRGDNNRRVVEQAEQQFEDAQRRLAREQQRAGIGPSGRAAGGTAAVGGAVSEQLREAALRGSALESLDTLLADTFANATDGFSAFQDAGQEAADAWVFGVLQRSRELAREEAGEEVAQANRESILEAAGTMTDFFVEGLLHGADTEDLIRAAALRLVSNFLLAAGSGQRLSFGSLFASAGQSILGGGQGNIVVNNDMAVIGDVSNATLEAVGSNSDNIAAMLGDSLERQGFTRAGVG